MNKYDIELNELKAQIYLFKMRYEISKVKALFYVNIFNSVKNTIDNFNYEFQHLYSNIDTNLNTKDTGGISNFNKEAVINNKINNTKDLLQMTLALKEKINLILSQNNKYYYQEIEDKFKSFEYRNYNFCNKDWDFESDNKHKNNEGEKALKNVEKNLTEILVLLNRFVKEDPENSYKSSFNNSENTSKNEFYESNNKNVVKDANYPDPACYKTNNGLNTLKIKIFACLKNLLSSYLFGENLCFEVRRKNSFILEAENQYSLYEQAERKNKILKEFINTIQPNVNKVINNKFKNEMIEKISSCLNFYENFNIILKNENTMLKTQMSRISQVKDYKINCMAKLIDQYIIFNEPSINKLKELIEISSSANLKNKEKLLIAYMNVECNTFYDFINKFYEIKNKFYTAINFE